jgi:DNA polymerase elongation subunit (family B)
MERFFSDWQAPRPTSSTVEVFLLEVLVGQRVPGDDYCPPTAFLFGRTLEGATVTVRVSDWQPWLRVVGIDTELPYSVLERHAGSWCLKNIARADGKPRIEHGRISKLFGWVGNDDLTTKTYACTKIHVTSLYAGEELAKHKYPGILVTDTLQRPRTRFLNDTGLVPCTWFSVPNTPGDRVTISNIEINCSVGDLVPNVRTAIPPLVLASFDCEMSSFDGTLPSPHKGDVVFCISTAFARFGLDKKIVSIMVAPNRAPEIRDGRLILYANSQYDLMDMWSVLIAHVDPDILTGWNIDGFDFAFLCEAYESVYMPNEERGSEALQAAYASSKHVSRVSLTECLSCLTAGQRNTILASFAKEFPTCASRVSKLFKQSDGSFALHEDDEEDTEYSTTLGPIHLKALRDAALVYYTGTPQNKTVDLNDFGEDAVDHMTRPQRTGRKYGMLLSRFVREECKLVEKTLSTAARGDNVMYKVPQSGRVVVDMMRVIKDDLKPSSNALRYAADTWLDNVSKLDMPIADLFQAWKLKDMSKLYEVETYCARDAEIPLLLMLKLQYVTSWIGLCSVCGLGPDVIVNGGQQQRVFALITRRVKDTHAVMTEPSGWPSTNDYVGATVIEPKAAFYETPLSTLDFASLYPSIEASNNLCFSTLVTDRSQLPKLVDSSGKKLYQDFAIQHPTSEGVETRHYAFVTHVPSVLADLLVTLLTSRKAVKREMESAEGFQREVLNKRQLALKVVCNSVYGFCGVDPEKGMLSCKPVAAATTLIGRRLIELTRVYVEKHFAGSDVVYGDTDSVMIHWNVNTLEEAFHLGERAAKDVTKYLRELLLQEQGGLVGNRDISSMVNIIKLEHEKEYWPYLLCKKKNYAGRKWTPKSLDPLVFKDEIDIKGLQAVRRDTAPLVVDLSMKVIDELLLRKSASSAHVLVRETLGKVAREQLPLESYVLSKSIGASYASENIPHVAAWTRMRARGQEAPPIGGRMPYVILAGHGSLAARAEHPSFAEKKKLDTPYYLKALENPLRKLLQFDDNTLDDLFTEAHTIAESRHSRSLVDGCNDMPIAPSPVKKRKRTVGVTRGLLD